MSGFSNDVSNLSVIEPGMVAVSSWAPYQWLRAAFSTRQGGESQAYGRDEQNLGWTDSDPASVVAINRERFVAGVVSPAHFELVTVRQSHSDIICRVSADHGSLATPEGKAVLHGDGLMTDLPGVLLGIQTADCVPVLVADVSKQVVAAYHAGWRGTLAQIVERGIGELKLHYGSDPADILAAIGPCIEACCFEIGGDVRDAFVGRFSYADELVSEVDREGSRIHLDLVEANRRQLLNAGVLEEHITAMGECTACTRTSRGNRKYFSHRSEKGFTGRMLSVIGIASE